MIQETLDKPVVLPKGNAVPARVPCEPDRILRFVLELKVGKLVLGHGLHHRM